jgi:hypothetical protein
MLLSHPFNARRASNATGCRKRPRRRNLGLLSRAQSAIVSITEFQSLPDLRLHALLRPTPVLLSRPPFRSPRRLRELEPQTVRTPPAQEPASSRRLSMRVSRPEHQRAGDASDHQPRHPSVEHLFKTPVHKSSPPSNSICGCDRNIAPSFTLYLDECDARGLTGLSRPPPSAT